MLEGRGIGASGASGASGGAAESGVHARGEPAGGLIDDVLDVRAGLRLEPRGDEFAQAPDEQSRADLISWGGQRPPLACRECLVPVPGGRWYRGIVGRRRLEAFLREYLPARRAGDGDDLFSVLCRVEVDGERFSDDDVINHMIFVLMAAHDTSTITISTMMQYLGQHPEWQQRCREESLAIPGDSISYEQVSELRSLDLVMKESMRLVSPVPTIARKAVKDTEVLGHFIPAGTMVAVAPYFTHHLEEYWPDPETFDPGRFSEERREDKVHRLAWQPFGGGVHKCIGLHFAGAEVSIVLHHLLRNFEWHVDPDYRAPMDMKSLPFPKDGQPVRLTRRSEAAGRG